MKYIDSEKLISEIEKKRKILVSEYNELAKYEVWRSANEDKIKINTISDILSLITSLQQESGSSENPNSHAEWSEEDIKKIRSEEYTKGFNDAAFGGKPNTDHTIWHNASEERPTKLPIIHIWYHGNRVNAVVTHENIGLQEELDDINFQPDDKWAYVEDLLNVQPQPITYVLDEPLGYDNDLNPIYPPINHWKPSEEQMEALKNSAYGAYQSGDGPALRELYDSLKKL